MTAAAGGAGPVVGEPVPEVVEVAAVTTGRAEGGEAGAGQAADGAAD